MTKNPSSSQRLSIKDWADSDRPREKMISQGKAVLTNAELLAILIGSGSASESAVALSQRILASVANSLTALGKLTLQQLLAFKGIGQAKAITILAATDLSSAARVMHKARLSVGGITHTVVDIRLLLKTALEQGAVSMILIHNHPSGSLTPSKEDIQLTQKVKEAGQLLDIRLLDHVIITEKNYRSLAEEGLC